MWHRAAGAGGPASVPPAAVRSRRPWHPGVIAIAGILLAAALYLGKRSLVNSIAKSAPGRFFTTWWFHAWGFDWLYDMIFVKPYLLVAKLLQRDPLNSMMNLPALFARLGNRGYGQCDPSVIGLGHAATFSPCFIFGNFVHCTLRFS